MVEFGHLERDDDVNSLQGEHATYRLNAGCRRVSLDGPTASLMGVRPRLAVEIPEVDDYTEGAWCPRCNRELHAIGTPHVPVELLVDDELVLALQDDDVETVPAFGWTCERHRVDVVLPAPYVIAPDPYRPVDADLDGDETTLAVPEPFLEDYDA